MAAPGIDGFSTATAMQALHTRQVSARELLDLYQRRIQRYNPQLNAIVVPCFERAARSGPSSGCR